MYQSDAWINQCELCTGRAQNHGHNVSYIIVAKLVEKSGFLFPELIEKSGFLFPTEKSGFLFPELNGKSGFMFPEKSGYLFPELIEKSGFFFEKSGYSITFATCVVRQPLLSWQLLSDSGSKLIAIQGLEDSDYLTLNHYHYCMVHYL